MVGGETEWGVPFATEGASSLRRVVIAPLPRSPLPGLGGIRLLLIEPAQAEAHTETAKFRR